MSTGVAGHPTEAANRARPLFPLLLIAAVAFLCGWLPSGLPLGLAPVDAFAVPVVIIGAPLVLRHGTDANRLFRSLLIGLVALLIANFLTMIDVGFASWQLDGMQRDFYVVIVFLCTYAIIEAVPFGVRWARAGFIGGALLSAVITFAQTGSRAGGTLRGNPNYAAHYLCTAVVVVFASPYRRSTKILLTVPLLAALLRTGSFMGWVFLGGVLLVRSWTALAQART